MTPRVPAPRSARGSVGHTCRERGSLVLLRHGRTRWNDEGRITGWEDPPLSEEGAIEARRAGKLISSSGLEIALVCSSPAQRAVHTADVVLEVLDIVVACPPSRLIDWRLNERHFGLLQGLDRATASERYGRKAVREWKHDRVALPPQVPVTDRRHPVHDARYRHVERRLLPGSESIAQFSARVLECWQERIEPCLEGGADVLVVGHCHSLRVLADQLDTPRKATVPPPFASPGSVIVYRGGRNHAVDSGGAPEVPH